MENAELFAEHLVVERDSNDPSRVNVLFPPDYINGLRIFAMLNQFRLSDLHQREAGLGDTLLITHIRAAVSGSPGETDHLLTTPVADVVAATNQILTLGVITWL